MDLPGQIDGGGSLPAPATQPPGHGGRPTDSSISRSVLIVGGSATAILIGLAVLDSSRVGLWQNLHWNVSAITAFVAVVTSIGRGGWTGRTGRARRIQLLQLSAAVAIGMWMLANIFWTVQVATNSRVIPSLPDLLAAAVLVPGGVGLVAYVRGRLSSATEVAVYLDAAVVATAVFTYLLIALAPTADELGGSGGLLALAAPLAYLTMAGAGLVALLATEHPLSTRGGFPIVAGLGLIGVAWVTWILPASTLLGEPMAIGSPLFSIGILLIGLGASTRQDTSAVSQRYHRMAPYLFRLMGPFAAGLTFLTILPIGVHAQGIEAPLRLAAVLTGVLILIRQALLLRERIAVVVELQEVRRENERLVVTLRSELEERARVHDQLINASRMAAIGELAAGVAHEVNNPLTGVLGYSELLLEEMAMDDPRRADVKTIWDEAMRARSIVRALRDFARPSSPEMVATDLPELIGHTLDFIRHPLNRAGVIIVESHGELPLIELDPHAIQQVMLNVLTNAMQAMSKGGTLRVETVRSGSDAVVTIADEGVGMDESVAGQAFLPFFTARQQPGSAGLGLPASLGLVESHGGSIRLTSKVGVGTTVEIRLPISHASWTPATADAAVVRDDAG
jgi:signal transduction histidine kinase